MRRATYFTCLLGLFFLFAFTTQDTDKPFRQLKHLGFSKGETLTYLAHYGFIHAGEAVVHLDENIHQLNNRPCYKVDVDGRTTGAFSMMVKVKDKWQSYIDTTSIMPHQFYRDISENKYRLQETTIFDQAGQKVKVKKIKKDGKIQEKYYDKVPTYSQDLVSGYYYLRTINYDKMMAGDTIKLHAFFEDSVYDFKLKYLGKEKLSTKFGKVETYVMSPIMPNNKMFDGENSIKFWVSADVNRVPLKVRAKMFIGAVEVDLIDYKGLKKDIGEKKQ
ncbi:MAG: hypothetical protein OHK0038_05560 [Flammeovirgaceae bacterium]